MSFLFGGGHAQSSSSSSRPADPVREYQDELHRGCRTLQREDYKAGIQEKELLSCITKHARLQRMDVCRIKAKELIRLREHRKRLISTRGHMTSLIQQLSTVQGTKTLQGVMSKTTAMLKSLNLRTMEPVAVQKMLHEFEKQSNLMEDSKEIMEDTLDGIFQGDTEDEAMDDTMATIFAELGLDSAAMFPSAGARGSRAVEDNNTLGLEDRLAKLRSGGAASGSR